MVLAGIPAYDSSGFYVFCYDSVCSDKNIVADIHISYNFSTSSKHTIIPYFRATFSSHASYCHSLKYHCVFTAYNIFVYHNAREVGEACTPIMADVGT